LNSNDIAKPCNLTIPHILADCKFFKRLETKRLESFKNIYLFRAK